MADKNSQNRLQLNKAFYSDIHSDMATILRTAIQVAEVSPSEEVTQLWDLNKLLHDLIPEI